ncbi:Uncharacterized protein TPAR_02724 [Tolypocladium paradoxum]|uniref:Heterokaryon incompatibility domain-containing protein n=1 Tax=Tolypocladium paradoxum TaxID=94208 RepID=A0A2S4L3S9_9HYPO|nr:Uncharacterized protein TPAR_02724 [Tolypocladium paradoxum]
MLKAIRSLARRRRRCGACLFALDPACEPLKVDIGGDSGAVFLMSDYHEVLYEDFVKSADRGCGRCKKIISTLGTCDVNFTTARWWPGQLSGGEARPYLELVEAHQKFELCVSTSSFSRNMSAAHPCICRGDRVAGNTGDTDALGQVAGWFAACRANHKQCNAMQGTSFQPTRLLFLGDKDARTTRLVENDTTCTGYAALSHRWSEETQRVRLERGNLAQRKQHGISLGEFPQMMRDVIHVLRQLGILYVWIDCMCIVQDDKDDWRREAATMASIYAHAELTVAATWCTSSAQSLFCDRNGDGYLAVDIADVKGQSVFFRRMLPHFTWQDIAQDWFANDDFVNPEREWPLLARGWVYQEQLLSRRMLHFSRHELLWECNEKMKCQCGWHTSQDSSVLPLASRYKQPVVSKEWSQIIKEYSKRDLTFSTDKLPALAGIAKSFSSQAAAKYLCGLWEEHLEQCFFWYLTGSARARPSGKVPTWSWASVSGNVDCWQSSIENVEFLGSDVTYYGDAYMGEVREAKIVISGPVVPATIHHGQSWYDCIKSAPASIQGDPGRLRSQGNGEAFGLKVEDQFATFQPDYQLDEPGHGFIPSGSQVWCLSFGRVTSSTRDPEKGLFDERVAVCCLVLRCVDEGESMYERIGLCQGSGPTDDTHLDLDKFLTLSQKRQLTLV